MHRLPNFLPAAHPEIPDCYIRLPQTGPVRGVLVAIHGISRNAAEIALRFAQSPDWDGWAIIAPMFEKRKFGQYQQLTAKKGKIPSDTALLKLMDNIALQYTLDVQQFSLFGFSGGAQMAHRFAMLHPQRIRKVFAVAAGWYMLPDQALAHPLGWADVGPNRNPELLLGLSVPMKICVGSDDKGRDKALRRSPVIDKRLGINRHNRARQWCGEMHQASEKLGVATSIEFSVLPNGTHDFGVCVEHGGLISTAAEYFN